MFLDLAIPVFMFGVIRVFSASGFSVSRNVPVDKEPYFDVNVVNITVLSGQTVVLPCSIEGQGEYRVSWIAPYSLPLTFNDIRVIDDTRFTVLRQNRKQWNLQIRDIRGSDRGQYRCVVSSDPVRSKLVNLHVRVSPEIQSSSSGSYVTVKEGDTVVLACHATGVPWPEVTWYRSKSTDRRSGSADQVILPSGDLVRLSDDAIGPLDQVIGSPGHTIGPLDQVIGSAGHVLIIDNVTRYSADVYKCMADNGVPPSAYREIVVIVQFAAEVTISFRAKIQSLDLQFNLECVVKAFPLSDYDLKKDNTSLIFSAEYNVKSFHLASSTSILLRLSISSMTSRDYGLYSCSASNSIGGENKQILVSDKTLKGSGVLQDHPGHGTPDEDRQLSSRDDFTTTWSFITDIDHMEKGEIGKNNDQNVLDIGWPAKADAVRDAYYASGSLSSFLKCTSPSAITYDFLLPGLVAVIVYH